MKEITKVIESDEGSPFTKVFEMESNKMIGSSGYSGGLRQAVNREIITAVMNKRYFMILRNYKIFSLRH